MSDEETLERALQLLHMLALENTGPSGRPRIFNRWHWPSEPLRHDAARLLNTIGHDAPRPDKTRRCEPPYWDGRPKP